MPRRSRSYSRSRSRSHDRDRWSRSPPRRRGRRNEFDYPPNTQVYVARFSRRTRESDLRRAFEKYGRIISVDVKFHGCFAFIVYDDAREAQDAIDEMNGRCLPYENDRLVVEFAGANRRRRRSPRGHRSPRRGPAQDDICYNCNQPGHWAADCREEPISKSREIREGRCFNCGEKGHKRADCEEERNLMPQKGGARKRSFSRGRSSSRSRSRSRSGSRRHHRKRSRSGERRSNKSERRDSAIERTSRKSGERNKSREKSERKQSRDRRDERSISNEGKDTNRSASKDTFKSASPAPENPKRSKSGSRDDPRKEVKV